MARITIAQLAETIAKQQLAIEGIMALLQKGNTVTPAQPQTHPEGEAGSITELRGSVGDTYKAFEAVFSARLRKAKPYAATNGPTNLWYIWSPSKARSYVQPMKQSTKCSNGTLLCTVNPDGTVDAKVKGLDLTV